MRLKITIEDVQTGDTEEVIAGMVVARHWEQTHGQSVAKAIEETPPSTIVELAHLAYNRKHGRSLTIEEFEERFEPIELDTGGKSPDPSDPATAPS